MGELVLDRSVVQHLAERDGLDPAVARARALDTLRLVAAGREAAAEAPGEAKPELSHARATQLKRSARARLWLKTEFEPRHRPEDIPEDDPLLARARGTSAWVHPRVHRVCQVIVMPPADLQGEAAEAMAEDPAWLEGAMAIAERVHHRAQRHVPLADDGACGLLGRMAELSGQPADARYRLRFEDEVGFDLEACAEHGRDGTCVRHTLVEEWSAVIGELRPPSLPAPFPTRFGVHVALLRGIEPARPPGDPATEAFLRQQIHRRWQTDAFARELERLTGKRTVRIASDEAPP